MKYKIGSFNVRNLSWGNKGRDLDFIASIIREYDIIALQEVLSEGKILEGPTISDPSGQVAAYERSLKYRLGDDWDMCWLDPKTKSKWYPYLGEDRRGEGYAFLWRKNRFRCPVNEYGKEIRPIVMFLTNLLISTSSYLTVSFLFRIKMLQMTTSEMQKQQ